jgi:hypothetical protein
MPVKAHQIILLAIKPTNLSDKVQLVIHFVTPLAIKNPCEVLDVVVVRAILTITTTTGPNTDKPRVQATLENHATITENQFPWYRKDSHQHHPVGKEPETRKVADIICTGGVKQHGKPIVLVEDTKSKKIQKVKPNT